MKKDCGGYLLFLESEDDKILKLNLHNSSYFKITFQSYLSVAL